MDKNKLDREMLEFMGYLVTSARGLVDEPALYGPFRLLEGVSKLCAILDQAGIGDQVFIASLQKKIDEGKFSLMTDPDAFIALMDDVVLDVTKQLVK
jgi:hypothetical protein